MKPQLWQIHQSGATVGQSPVWDGSNWVPATPAPTSDPLFSDDDTSPLVADDASNFLYSDT